MPPKPDYSRIIGWFDLSKQAMDKLEESVVESSEPLLGTIKRLRTLFNEIQMFIEQIASHDDGVTQASY